MGWALESVALGIAESAVRAPRRRPGVIDRSDLVKQLLDTAGCRVVSISAPAGYGKSTTLLLWDEADERDFIWVHLDERDDDPIHFLQHVAMACDRYRPLDELSARRLTGSGRSAELDLVPALGQVVSATPEAVLVLDDAHHLRSPSVLHVLEGVMAYVPEGSQMALSGRAVPDVALARRRMSGELAEITLDDLAMSRFEASRMLEHLGAAVDDDGLDRLLAQTEGWAGGIHLAGLALSRVSPDVSQPFSGRDRSVGDYLVEEVLAGLPDDTVWFLCRSSVLERMRASLLDDLLEIDSSGRRLTDIERSGNLFLVPLDNERTWFRYHHLFADLLRARLLAQDPGEASRLHARASVLVERDGDIDAAIGHAVEAGDVARAADLVLVHGPDLGFRGRVATFRRWLDRLGDDAQVRLPAAALAWAWYGVVSGDAAVLRRALTVAESSDEGPLADGSPSAAVGAAMVRALIALNGMAGVLRDTAIVREVGGPDQNPLWSMATVVEGTARSMLGEAETARDLLQAGLPRLSSPTYAAATQAHLALLDLQAGDVHEAERQSSLALALTVRHNLETALPALAVFAVEALVAAKRGRPDDALAAADTAQRLLARLGGLSPRTAVMGYTLLARAAMAAGDRAQARLFVREANIARRREPAAVLFNRMLDDLERDLTDGADEIAFLVVPLTPAESRVLVHLPTHLSLQEIAEQLIISRNTAKSHAVAIYRKLGVSSRSEAVAAARRLGLIDA